jgi:ribosomal protein S18 acetylase RimI-like enzyme
MIEIRQAVTESELDDVRALVHAFMDWARDLYPEGQAVFDYNFRAVVAELGALPGPYGPPRGQLLVAYQDNEAAGTVALRDLGQQTCEMKRMFVYAKFRGQGIGQAMAARLIAEARALGYARMRLDTGPRHIAAQGLYRSFGFQEIPPYYEVPEDIRPMFIFMELRL